MRAELDPETGELRARTGCGDCSSSSSEQIDDETNAAHPRAGSRTLRARSRSRRRAALLARTPPFGRIAAQMAKQVIFQKVHAKARARHRIPGVRRPSRRNSSPPPSSASNPWSVHLRPRRSRSPHAQARAVAPRTVRLLLGEQASAAILLRVDRRRKRPAGHRLLCAAPALAEPLPVRSPRDSPTAPSPSAPSPVKPANAPNRRRLPRQGR